MPIYGSHDFFSFPEFYPLTSYFATGMRLDSRKTFSVIVSIIERWLDPIKDCFTAPAVASGNIDQISAILPVTNAVAKDNYQQMIVEPIPFRKHVYEFLVHDKAVLENKALRIHPKFQDLIVAMKGAYMEGTIFVKERSPNNDLLDALSECLSKFKPKTLNTLDWH
jgi:hypothetical protein